MEDEEGKVGEVAEQGEEGEMAEEQVVKKADICPDKEKLVRLHEDGHREKTR